MGSIERELPVKQSKDHLTIGTSTDALKRVKDAIRGDTAHSELEYLNGLLDLIRYAQADGFDVENGIDNETDYRHVWPNDEWPQRRSDDAEQSDGTGENHDDPDRKNC